MIALRCPFTPLIEVAARVWPGLSCEVTFGDPGPRKLGVTIFHDDGSPPMIVIRIGLPIDKATGILAHELCHVAVPADRRHGSRFRAAHQRLWDAWCETHGKPPKVVESAE